MNIRESKAKGVFIHTLAQQLRAKGLTHVEAIKEASLSLNQVDCQQYLRDNGYLWNELKQEWVKI